MNVAIITIGDELLLGQVTDTNSGMMARTLAPLGWKVVRCMTVGDDATAICRGVELAFESAPVVLVTGGLGPTKDDITKRVMLRLFGGCMQRNAEVLENVKHIFAQKGLEMNDLTASQADVPSSCRVIQNRVGTAPIMWFEREGGRQVLVSMPGVPSETTEMFQHEVLDALLAHFSGSSVKIYRNTIVCHGISESGLAESLAGWEENLPSTAHLAYLPVDGLIKLRLDVNDSEPVAQRLFAELKQNVARWLVAESDLSAPEILLAALRAHNVTVATAESCTGGNICHRLTLVPGCSDVVLGGVVSYCNSVKVKLLGVKEESLKRVGAVSEEVAAQMAQGACNATGATLGIATSGIAGPGGAVPGKPVGTVCMAVHYGDVTHSFTCHFSGNRSQIIERATTEVMMAAVKMLNQ